MLYIDILRNHLVTAAIIFNISPKKNVHSINREVHLVWSIDTKRPSGIREDFTLIGVLSLIIVRALFGFNVRLLNWNVYLKVKEMILILIIVHFLIHSHNNKILSSQIFFLIFNLKITFF